MPTAELQQYKMTLERYLSSTKEGKTPTKDKDEKDVRIPTLICIKATDHVLRVGTGLSLTTFFNPWPVRRLKSTETRYYILAADLEADLVSDGQTRRACIFDSESNKTRLELIGLGDKRNRLHARSDRGSLGWTQWFPLFAASDLCGSFFYDEPHKCWDDDRAAAKNAGLGALLSSFLMVVNIGKCPFGSYSFQHQIHGCAESYFSQATVDCPYFLYWYEFLRGHDDKDTGLKKNFLDY